MSRSAGGASEAPSNAFFTNSRRVGRLLVDDVAVAFPSNLTISITPLVAARVQHGSAA